MIVLDCLGVSTMPSPAPTNDRLLLHLVLHTAKLLEGTLRNELEPLGVHHGQGRVLDALSRHPDGLTQVEIARGLGMLETAATQVVRRLHELELLERVEDPADSRAMRITLTLKGRRTANNVRAAWRHVEDHLTQQLTRPGIQGTRAALEQLRDAMGGADPTV
jgi:DNA-binding MarR family transcriptional regulator